MRVMGIDPGLTRCGLSVVQTGRGRQVFPVAVGVARTPAEEVRALASMVKANGADGIVCSPQEAAAMRELLGPEALIVTPGVRPAGTDVGDQSRIATPASAIQAGASMLVVGRPITQAADPVAAYERCVREFLNR